MVNVKIDSRHFKRLLEDRDILGKDLAGELGLHPNTFYKKYKGKQNLQFNFTEIVKILEKLNMKFEEVFIIKN